MKIQTLCKLVVAIAVCQLAGIIGSIFTFSEIPTWYATLVKPELNPPSWIFGPVWTTLYVLMGIAAFLVWRKGLEHKDVKKALIIFSIHLILNSLWSIVFFAIHSPLWAFVNIILLWLIIVWIMKLFYKISKPTLWLLIPYILWVSFASYLNYSIWTLNRAPVFDGKNTTVMIDGRAIALVNGISEISTVPGSTSKITTRYFGNEATGDLTGDNIPDIAFLITQDTGGSGLFYYAVVAIKTSTGYRITNTFPIGDRIAPQSTYIPTNSHELQVNYAERRAGEPMTTTPSVGAVLLLKVTPDGILEGLMK
jgi:tryptophan-rich sensory protein